MPTEMLSHFPQRVVAYLVDRRQIPLPEIIDAVGLPPEIMLREDLFVSEETYKALIRYAIGRTGEGALGLDYGRNLQLSDFGMLGYAAGAQDTVAAGLELFARYYDGMSRLSRLTLDKAQGYFLRVLLEPGLPTYMTWFISEAMLAAALQNLARFRVPLSSGINAHFAYPRPPHARRYDELAVPCYFQSENTGLFVPEPLLSLPLSGAQSRARWPDALELSARRSPLDSNPVSQITSIVCALLPTVPSLAEVAQRLGISPRALQRRLEKQGLGFRQLVSEIRVKEAAERLRGTELSVRQVAEQTGFSDAASFTRAFRRVFSMTPGQYRQKKTDERGAY